MSIFKNEKELIKWIGKNQLIDPSPESPLNVKKPILNLNLVPKRGKYFKGFTKKFPYETPPLLTEFDLIFIPEISYSWSNEKFTIYSFKTAAVEIKYFRKTRNGKNYWRYYAGLDQILAYQKFGFKWTELWHFFDPDSQEIVNKYVKNLRDLLEKTQLKLPIFYRYYLIEPGEKEKEFNKHKLNRQYSNFNLNPYQNEETNSFNKDFISAEIEEKYGKLFKETPNSPTANSTNK